MRQWSTGPLHHSSSSAELLLTPVPVVLSTRDDSPIRERQPQTIDLESAAFQVVVEDILMLELVPKLMKENGAGIRPRTTSASSWNSAFNASSQVIHMTTLSNGFFQIDCRTRNAHDTVMAFLQLYIKPDRIIKCDDDAATLNSMVDGPRSGVSPSFSERSSCLDIDGLTAQQMNGQMENETWPEKMSRRIHRVVYSLSELSESFCDVTSCCQSATATGDHASSREPVFSPDERDSPPPSFQNRLEMDCGDSQTSRSSSSQRVFKRRTTKTSSRPSNFQLLNLPSGLSVEESELESTA